MNVEWDERCIFVAPADRSRTRQVAANEAFAEGDDIEAMVMAQGDLNVSQDNEDQDDYSQLQEAGSRSWRLQLPMDNFDMIQVPPGEDLMSTVQTEKIVP